ncbi:MAG: hypothetical protein HYZ21_06830 [Chloroflexi bacterium]|nr:hypothetical protein [Chloroflexota bacterium]
MSANSFPAKFLRFIGILLMAFTGGFTLLGGIGTTCAALLPTKYESMAALASFQWVYILFVLTGIALGIMGIRATIMLIKGADNSYRDAVYVLLAGAVIGFGHMDLSRALRGKSMPVDAVVYTTVLTLVIFLLFRIPYIWQGVNFANGNTKSNLPAGGASAIMLGILTLTIQYTMASTHTWNGVNYADAFNISMSGIGLLLLGAGILISGANVWGRAGRLMAQERSG